MPKRLKTPKCLYCKTWYCLQRTEGPNQTFYMQEYGIPDKHECAACLAAQLNWGDGASIRPMHKAEVDEERKKFANS